MTNERVIIYTTPECGVCDRARADMTAEGIDFEERNVMKSKEWFNDVLKHTIFVPLIFRGDQMEIGWKGAVG
jgi:glutaredoxin